MARPGPGLTALGALVLAGCAVWVDDPPVVSWRTTGLPRRFDYDCEVTTPAHASVHERFSVDLAAGKWGDDLWGVRPIDRIEASRIEFEAGTPGTDANQRIVDTATGAYFHQLNTSEPVMSVTFRGVCKLARYTPLERRAAAHAAMYAD
jgi:hypothetical protein